MTRKMIPALFLLTACGGPAFAPMAPPPELDAGSVEVRDAGPTMELDAGHITPDAGVDAGHEEPVDAGEVDSGLPEHDAGTADAGTTPEVDAGDGSCPAEESLVMGSTCGRQTIVSCVPRWAECGLIGQVGCNTNGSAGGALCYEGGRFSGTGFCVACR